MVTLLRIRRTNEALHFVLVHDGGDCPPSPSLSTSLPLPLSACVALVTEGARGKNYLYFIARLNKQLRWLLGRLLLLHDLRLLEGKRRSAISALDDGGDYIFGGSLAMAQTVSAIERVIVLICRRWWEIASKAVALGLLDQFFTGHGGGWFVGRRMLVMKIIARADKFNLWQQYLGLLVIWGRIASIDMMVVLVRARLVACTVARKTLGVKVDLYLLWFGLLGLMLVHGHIHEGILCFGDSTSFVPLNYFLILISFHHLARLFRRLVVKSLVLS